jgi:ferredoxin-NADP reductase
MHTLTVRDIIFRSEELFELQLERGDLSFDPGSCLALFNDGEESRPYSIASGRGEKLLRFLIRRLPNGLVSNWLATRSPGDKVKASDPFGWFRPGRSVEGERCVFIATGTGIAPFLSYLRSNPQQPPALCLYGVRRLTEALNLDELQKIPDFHLALSREKRDHHTQGRVSELLDLVPLAADIHYYLCGLDSMIDEVSGWLEHQGIAYTQLHREIFFYEEEQPSPP